MPTTKRHKKSPPPFSNLRNFFNTPDIFLVSSGPGLIEVSPFSLP